SRPALPERSPGNRPTPTRRSSSSSRRIAFPEAEASMRIAALSLLLLTLPVRGSDSLRVIEAQNKVAAAQYLRGLGFSFPAPLVQKLLEEEAEALRAVRENAGLGLKDIDTQLDELKRVNEKKNEEAQKLLVTAAKRVIKDSVKLGEILGEIHKADLNKEKAIGLGILLMCRDAEAILTSDSG